MAVAVAIFEANNWRASEVSETLFSHVYGISRYIIYIYTRVCSNSTNGASEASVQCF